MPTPTRRKLLQATAGSLAVGSVGLASAGPGNGNGGNSGNGGPDNGRGKGHGPPAGDPFPNEDNPRYFVGVTSKDAAKMVRGLAREIHFTYDWGPGGWTVLGRFKEQTRRALENRPRIRYVEEDRYVEPHATADCDSKDPSSEECTPWGMDRIDVDTTMVSDSPFDDDGNNETGQGADVAVLDTGADAVHDDLQSHIGTAAASFSDDWDVDDDTTTSTLSCNCIDSLTEDGTCNQPWDDDGGHGTHTDGTVGAIANNSVGVQGAAANVTLHPGKVLHGDICSCCNGGPNGCSQGCDDACLQDCNSNGIIAAAIKWAADQGFDVINMSLGGGGASDVIRDAMSYAYYGHSAAQSAGHSGNTLVVSSAGNPGGCPGDGGTLYGDVSYPAAYSHSMAVSATRHDDELAYYSAAGPEVDIAAPGGSVWNNTSDCNYIYSTWGVISSYPRNSYAYTAGTSMAAPHVSGAAALLIDKGMDPMMAREQLESTAEDIGLSSEKQGYGLLDAARALALDSSDSGGVSSLGLNVVRGQQDRVDSTTARLYGWWSSTEYSASDIDTVGFKWREYDGSSFGPWNSWTSSTIPENPPKFSHEITMKDQSVDGCYAYQYYATVTASDGSSDSSRAWAFWNSPTC